VFVDVYMSICEETDEYELACGCGGSSRRRKGGGNFHIKK
jgi:hypothetical protein